MKSSFVTVSNINDIGLLYCHLLSNGAINRAYYKDADTVIYSSSTNYFSCVKKERCKEWCNNEHLVGVCKSIDCGCDIDMFIKLTTYNYE